MLSLGRSIIGRHPTMSIGIVTIACLAFSSINTVLAQSTSAEAKAQTTCLEKASTDRSTALKKAYDRYGTDTKDAADLMKKAQTDALKSADTTRQAGELQRVTARYSADIAQANATLAYSVQQIWADYQNRSFSCGVHGAAAAVPSYGGYAGWTDYRWPYGYGYAQYGYGAPYGYDPSSWYGMGYGTYAQYQPAPIPWVHTGYPANYLSPSGYASYGYTYCPQVVLPTIPAGCGYECSRDDRGCTTCEVSCRNVKTDALRCACPQTSAPVCGADSRTYTNSCFAQCADVRIAYGGSCMY